VQQVLMTINIALLRQIWQLDYYSEGSVPDAPNFMGARPNQAIPGLLGRQVLLVPGGRVKRDLFRLKG
jgi:hypothetical protein